MNVKEMKALNLQPGQKRSLGPEDTALLKVKKVRNWFGQDKEHVGVTLEDASGEWISAAVFNAPSEIAKMEGEWIPIEPTPGSQSGVWLEGESYTARNGPKAGQEVRATGMKIMGGCFRWDKPQGAPEPTQAPSQGGSARGRANMAPGAVQRHEGGALPLAEYQRWWMARWEWYENSPPIQRAIDRGEAVAQAIRDAIGAEWMSQPPSERNIERTPYRLEPEDRTTSPDPWPASGQEEPDDDIPF